MQRNAKLEHPTGKVQTLLDAVKRSLGVTPNFFTTLAQAPTALEAYLGFNVTLSDAVLPFLLLPENPFICDYNYGNMRLRYSNRNRRNIMDQSHCDWRHKK